MLLYNIKDIITYIGPLLDIFIQPAPKTGYFLTFYIGKFSSKSNNFLGCKVQKHINREMSLHHLVLTG